MSDEDRPVGGRRERVGERKAGRGRTAGVQASRGEAVEDQSAPDRTERGRIRRPRRSSADAEAGRTAGGAGTAVAGSAVAETSGTAGPVGTGAPATSSNRPTPGAEPAPRTVGELVALKAREAAERRAAVEAWADEANARVAAGDDAVD